MDAGRELEEFARAVGALREEIGKAVVGQREVVEQILVCLLADGHALLEGAPGLGKTLLVRTLAQCLSLRFARVQFTPDLMPADILGTNVIVEDEGGRKGFQFQPGPVFCNVLLADEINRATPKTQSALLEAMQERAVTLAGERRALAPPFLVLATQNPIEMEGTYPLPEAQLDRFLYKILLEAPDEETLVSIVRATTGERRAEPRAVLDAAGVLRMQALARRVPVAEPLLQWAARLVRATDPAGDAALPVARKYLRYGAGVRGAQALVLAGKVTALMSGRAHVSPDDLRAVAQPALRHRLILNFEGEAEGILPDTVIGRVLEELPELPRDLARI
jgi:MoxR-like ATPase